MSLCPLSRILAPLALAAVVVAGVARAEAPAKPEKLVHKVYNVADLIVAIPGMRPAAAPAGFACQASPCTSKPCCAAANTGCCAEKPPAAAPACANAPPATCEQQLMKLITASISPDSWAAVGGRGTIEYMPIGMAIVVNQTPEVQEQVAELLDRVRRVQDFQVALEVRVMSIGDCLFEQIADDFGLLRQPTALLDGCGMARLLERVQGNPRANIVQAPKLTTFSGQEATIRAGDEQLFVTGLSSAQSRGQTVVVPQNQAYWTGLKMTMQPTVTPDRRNILLKLQAEIAEMSSPDVPLFPVTALVTPVFEGGAQGQPVPFTQFLQQPTIMKRGITKVLGIPEGQTAVFCAGRGTRTVMDVDYLPVLGHIPFVCELFKTETPRQESDHLIFLVTPRVMVNAEEKPCAAKACAERQCGVAAEWRPAPHCVASPEYAVAAPCPGAAPAACAAEQLPMPVARPPAPQVLSCPMTPCTPEIQVKTDLTVLSLDDSYFNRPEAAVWSDLSPKACDGKPAFLSPEEAKRFTRMICDNGGELMSRPQVMTLDGQKARVQIGGEREFAVGLKMIHCDGKYLPEVQRERRTVGTSLTFTPSVSADHRFVRLALCAECSRVCSHAEAGCKVTAHVTPADGSAPQKVTLDPPAIDVQQMETTMTCPFGRTALIYGCCAKDDLGRTRRCAILITPEMIKVPADVVRHAPPMPTPAPMPVYAVAPMVLPHPPIGYPVPPVIAEEQAVPPPPPVDQKLTRLMRRYQEACAEGRTSAAKKLAAKCLEIDPTCFGRD